VLLGRTLYVFLRAAVSAITLHVMRSIVQSISNSCAGKAGPRYPFSSSMIGARTMSPQTGQSYTKTSSVSAASHS